MPTEGDFIETFLERIRNTEAGFIERGPKEDDCATLEFGNEYIVVSTDRVNSSPISFSLGLKDYSSLGRILCAANMSDLLATGVSPSGLLVNMYLPGEVDEQRIEEIADGVSEYATEYDCPVLGGDTKIQENMTLSGTCVGIADSREQLRFQDCAEPGDLIVLSGPVGDCYASTLARSESEVPPGDEEFVRKSILDPGVPYELNREFVSRGIGKGGLDISDGLGSDLKILAAQSEVGLRVVADKIPIREETERIAERFGVDATELAFGFGGDWEFVATVDESNREKIPDSAHVIGRVTAERACQLVVEEETVPLPHFGHDDFSKDGFLDQLEKVIA